MGKQRQSTLRWCKDVALCPHYLHLEVSIKICEMLCVYCIVLYVKFVVFSRRNNYCKEH